MYIQSVSQTSRSPLYLTDDVSVLETDGDGLSLNRRRFPIADLVDNLQNITTDSALLPFPDGIRHFSALETRRGNVSDAAD